MIQGATSIELSKKAKTGKGIGPGKNVLAALIGVGIALALGEGFLRLLPNHFTRYGSTVRYAFDPDQGYKLYPGSRASFNMSCFRNNEISVNSHGFRDDEWRGGSNFKIAILGDSFMEALQVPDDSTTAARLEDLSGVEVLNTGLSGFGTAGQSIIFEKHLAAYRPDVTLLFYYPPNDLINNSCALNDSTHNAFFAPCPCGISVGKYPVTRTDFQDTIPKPGWLWRKSMVWRVITTITTSSQPVYAAATYDAYRKPYRGEWQTARTFTEYYFTELSRQCREVNSRLIVVTVPSYLSQAQEEAWEEEILAIANWDKLPTDFDREYPNEVVREICQNQGIPIWELEPVFRQYRDVHDLQPPTFFFECNGHWNSLGHRLAAETVLDSLKTKGLLGY